MKVARVSGTVVSTICSAVFCERRLMFCDYVNPDGSPTGEYAIAVDTVGAGEGETVLILDEGTGARQILGEQVAPVRALIVGIVDQIG